MKQIVLPEKLEQIGKSCFSHSGIEALDVPRAVREIKERAFLQCEKLRAINFADGSALEELGKDAFKKCD